MANDSQVSIHVSIHSTNERQENQGILYDSSHLSHFITLVVWSAFDETWKGSGSEYVISSITYTQTFTACLSECYKMR